MYTLLIVFFLVAIVTSFLCSLWEAVLLSITPSYAQIQVQHGGTIGRRLQAFKENVDRPLAAILTLNTIAHTVGAIGVGDRRVVHHHRADRARVLGVEGLDAELAGHAARTAAPDQGDVARGEVDQRIAASGGVVRAVVDHLARGRDVGSIRVRDGQGRDVAHDVMFAFAFHAFYPNGRWMLD